MEKDQTMDVDPKELTKIVDRPELILVGTKPNTRGWIEGYRYFKDEHGNGYVLGDILMFSKFTPEETRMKYQMCGHEAMMYKHEDFNKWYSTHDVNHIGNLEQLEEMGFRKS